MTYIKHEIKMNMKSLMIWGLTVGIMLFSFMMLYPILEESMGDMLDAYSNMGSFTEALGMDKVSFATAMGYYGIECGAVLSLGGAMFAALTGISMLAKEEGGHTTEYIYVTPNSRMYFITTKLISTIIIILLFNIFCSLLAMGGFAAVGQEIEWSNFLLYQLSQIIMHTQIALICFGISAFLRKNNIGLGIGIAALLYFVNLFANVTDKLEGLHYITPFYYSDAANVFSEGKIDLPYVIVGMSIAIVMVILGYIKYIKKDLNV